MYQSELLDAYKKAQNYIQDKQIAHDLNMPAPRISEMRKGKRYLSDEEAIFLAENAGIDKEVALLGCHADRNENPEVKALWANIAKKYNGLGFTTISSICGAILVTSDSLIGSISKFALCTLC